MQHTYKTKRLILNELSLDDVEFIKELVNTDGWIKYIGDRNIKTTEDAIAYVKKIIDNPSINYWVVKLLEGNRSIGIITFIKRDYLEHHDIGFAFLPAHTKRGYALEAAIAILNDAIYCREHKQILATTIKENTNSIKLLEKLGLQFEKQIQQENDVLLIYSVSSDKILLNQITDDFFGLFINKQSRSVSIDKIYTICLPEIVIIKKNADTEEILDLNTFIEPRKKILSDGTLSEFEECETFEDTRIMGNIAQRFSKYKKSGFLNGKYFQGNGNKLFQYVKTKNGWQISSVLWEDENL